MKRALGSLEAKIREAYNKGYKDGLKDGTNQMIEELIGMMSDKWDAKSKDEPLDEDDIGDCNICKYIGLEHRCNQCVNGSQFYKIEDEPTMRLHEWTSDDITFCTAKCEVKCFRKPKYIKHKGIPHSFSDFSSSCAEYEPKDEQSGKESHLYGKSANSVIIDESQTERSE